MNIVMPVDFQSFSPSQEGLGTADARAENDQRNIIESAQKDGWSSAMRDNKAYCDSIIYQEKPVDTPLPWDFLDNRVKKEFLSKEFLKAKQEKNSPSCPMIDCIRCNTCI